MHDFRPRDRRVHQGFRIDVLQDGDFDFFSGFGEIERAGIWTVLAQERADAFAIVGNREIHQLRSLRGNGHELKYDVDLAGLQIGNPRIGCLAHELHLGWIVEQPFGQQAGHLDVEALQIAFLVLEMPGRVGAAGTDDDRTAFQDFMKLARTRSRRRDGTAAASSRDHRHARTQPECGRFQEPATRRLLRHCPSHVLFSEMTLSPVPEACGFIDDFGLVCQRAADRSESGPVTFSCETRPRPCRSWTAWISTRFRNPC